MQSRDLSIDAQDADGLLAHLDWARGLALRLVDDPARADDLAQEASLRWLRARPQDAQRGPGLRAWFVRFLQLAAYGDLRSERRRRLREIAAAGTSNPADAAGDVVERSEWLQRVADAVSHLDEPGRTTVLLRYFDGLSHRQIAERCGATVPAVRKRLSRALARLRLDLDLADASRRQALLLAALPGVPLPTLLSVPVTAMSKLTTWPVLAAVGVTVTAAAATFGAGFFSDGSRPEVPPRLARVEPGAIDSAPPPAARPGTRIDAEPEPLVREAQGAEPVARGTNPAQDPSPADSDPFMSLRMDRANHPDLPESSKCSDCHSGGPHQPIQRLDDGYRREMQDGVLLAEGLIELGRRSGLWTEYHPDGAVRAQGEYFAGERHGPWVQKHANGQTAAEGSYLYGRQEGSWSYRNEAGRLQRRTEYRNGLRHGTETQFDADGTQRSERFVLGAPQESGH